MDVPTPPDVRIREATVDDTGTVGQLLVGLGYREPPQAVSERLGFFAASDRDTALVAELDRRVVGVLALSLLPRFAQTGWYSRIVALAVDPQVQRAGVGRHLVAEAERLAVAAGSTLMQVNSGRRPERNAAHRFYVALGYADQHDHHILYDKPLVPDGSTPPRGAVEGR